MLEELRLKRKKAKVLSRNAGVIEAPGDGHAPFPPLLGSEGLLSISWWAREARPRELFLFLLP